MRRFSPALLIISTIFSTLLAAASSLLINAINLPSSVKELAPPFLGICLVFSILFGVMLQTQQPKDETSSKSVKEVPFSHPYNRSKLLDDLKKDWFDDYLGSVIFKRQVLQVEVMYQPNAVDSSNRPHSVSPEASGRMSVHHLSDLSRDGLLIYGSSGAGKTVALVELTRTLLDYAEKDDRQPIPVILSLSSWNTKYAHLNEWIVQELQNRYRVSSALAQYWIEADQLAPLLDDFDMVADIYRAECIQVINKYRQQHGLVPLVVCSRSVEYLEQPVRLQLRHAVVLQPLSSSLITSFVALDNKKLQPIRTILKNYPRLLTYVRIPRFLDLLGRYIAEHVSSKQAYRSLIQGESMHLVEQRLLEGYVQQQLEQIPLSFHVTPLQIRQTLRWLALNLRNRRQILFTLEELQPSWLPDEALRQEAQQRMRLLIIFVFLIVGQLNGIILSQSGRMPFLTISFVLSQIAGRRFLKMIKDRTFVQKSYTNVSVSKVIAWAWKHDRTRLLKIGLRMVGSSVLIVLAFAVVVGIIASIWKGWNFGLLSGLLLGLFAGICLFAGGSVGALRIGLVSHRRQPQDSMWRSARYGMLSGLLLGTGVGGIAFVVTQLLQFGLKSSPWFALAIGVSSGLNVWLFCSLINGGYALLQYLVLRSLLRKAGVASKDLAELLHIAVQCRLLCLINSSYMFPHRWLRDYFASPVRREANRTNT